MNSLKKIQKIVNIMKVVTSIIFVSDVATIVICIPAFLVILFWGSQILSSISQMAISLAGKEVVIGKATALAAVCVLLVNCASSALLCHFTSSYLKKEIATGTPFTQECATGLFHLGILFILLPIGTSAICSIGLSILENFYPGLERLSMGNFSTIYIGLMLLLISLICRSATEIQSDMTLK